MEICVERSSHTKQPADYISWHSWAEEKYKKGYRQHKCPMCGFYAIWLKPKKHLSNPVNLSDSNG